MTFGWPPLAWLSARFKWEIRSMDGSNVFVKTISNPLLQRAITLIGHPDLTEYTIAADVRSDAKGRRGSSKYKPGAAVGVICQRYIVLLQPAATSQGSKPVPSA